LINFIELTNVLATLILAVKTLRRVGYANSAMGTDEQDPKHAVALPRGVLPTMDIALFYPAVCMAKSQK